MSLFARDKLARVETKRVRAKPPATWGGRVNEALSPPSGDRAQRDSQTVGVSRVETKKAETLGLGLVRSLPGAFGLHTVVSSCGKPTRCEVGSEAESRDTQSARIRVFENGWLIGLATNLGQPEGDNCRISPDAVHPNGIRWLSAVAADSESGATARWLTLLVAPRDKGGANVCGSPACLVSFKSSYCPAHSVDGEERSKLEGTAELVCSIDRDRDRRHPPQEGSGRDFFDWNQYTWRHTVPRSS